MTEKLKNGAIRLLLYYYNYDFRGNLPLGLLKWMMLPSSRNKFASSMPAMGFRPSFLKELVSFLSSAHTNKPTETQINKRNNK